MAKSIRFGTMHTKMQNLWQSLLFIAFLLLVSAACKTKVVPKSSGYLEPYLRDTIPYTLASHEKLSDKVLLFLPPVLDQVNFEETEIYQQAFERGYDILSVYKPEPKGAFYYSRKGMDFKNQNVQNVQNLIQHLRKSGKIKKKAKFHIFAMEQGVYMAPAIASFLEADTLFLINANPFSTYYGLQRIADGTFPWDEKRQKFVKEQFNIDSLNTFQQKVADVEATTSEKYSLGDYMNMYWLSYHSNYYVEEYARLTGHTAWVYFADYPLYKESDFKYQKLLDKTRREASGFHKVIDASGRFKEKEDWKKLAEALKPYFKD